MNESAKVLAEWYVGLSKTTGNPVATNCLHIYSDGYVLVLDGDSDRHLTVRQALFQYFPGVEEARVRGITVFVIPYANPPQNVESDTHPIIAGPTLKGGWKDHRQEDWHTLDIIADVAKKTVAIFEGWEKKGANHD
jgi:hypothetical protein